MKSQALASAGVGAINVLGTIVAGSLVDKAGRKQLLLVSFLGMAASMLAMSAGLGLPSLQVLASRRTEHHAVEWHVQLPNDLSTKELWSGCFRDSGCHGERAYIAPPAFMSRRRKDKSGPPPAAAQSSASPLLCRAPAAR